MADNDRVASVERNGPVPCTAAPGDGPGAVERVRGASGEGGRLLRLGGVWLLGGVALLLLTGSVSATILFFVVYPLLWLVTRTRRGGVVATLVFSLGIVLAFRLGRGASWGDAAINGAFSAVFSLCMGLWFWRVYEVSGQRREALEREREARAALRAAQEELVAAEREAARTAEREQWARDVHDTLAQGFVSVVTLAQAAGGELERGESTAVAERLAQLEEVARENLAEARALVAGEGPSRLRSGGLRAALGRLADEQRRLGRAARLETAALREDLPRETQVVVLRVVQEALSNVSRHSGAERVAVRAAVELLGGRHELVVTVEDDGTGTAGAPEGTGLTGMRARVEAVGGTVTVDPAHAPGPEGSTGTVLEARIPL